ncbi:MAG: peptidylprolyl isomerase [Campylobacterales bacterium]|nr:peptidylprolyl isomerase [Campylobacterales bacterium]
MSNKVISIEYTLNDAKTNEKLDSNVGQAPLKFISGMNQIIPGLEKELEKCAKGDKINVMVNPADAYGEYNDQAVQTLPKEQFAGIDLVQGMSLYGTGEDGSTVQVTVKDIAEDSVTIDYNHPMAGRSLMFTVAILDVRDATAEELQTGVVGGLAAMSGGCCGGGSCGSHGHSRHHDDEDHECCGAHTGEKSGGCCNSH